MGLVSAYSQPGRSGWGVGEKEAIELLKSALNMGVTFWDTAQLCASAMSPDVAISARGRIRYFQLNLGSLTLSPQTSARSSTAC